MRPSSCALLLWVILILLWVVIASSYLLADFLENLVARFAY